MTKKIGLLVSLLILITICGKSVYAELPHFRLFDNYFLSQNSSYLSVDYDMSDIGKTSLHGFMFNLNYGVSDAFQVGFSVPYFKMSKVDDNGYLGDLSLDIKFSIVQSKDLNWRVCGEMYLNMGTGVTEGSSKTLLDGQYVEYYPFISGLYHFSPSVTGSLLKWDFMFHGTIGYTLINDKDEGIFSFQDPITKIALEGDRFYTQISFDYFFKLDIGLDNNQYLGIRPAVYLDFQKNVSTISVVPDNLSSIIEVNFKINNIVKWNIYGIIPIYTQYDYLNYQIGGEIGKKF